MTRNRLVVLLSGSEIGQVTRDRQGRLAFTYREEWRVSRDALPLSLSMPLAAAEHSHARIEAFLWGLLPDNELVLDRWSKRFQVSARNAFALLSHVGEDCAGAVQLVKPERAREILSTDPSPIEWLDEAAIAERLRTLRVDPAAWRVPGDTGQFSLAGAQPKTALLYENGRWGVPSGRTPTTHILKPPTGDFDGYVENEHLCLVLARELGLPATFSEVRRFGDEVAIVVERYDRARTAALASSAAADAAAHATAAASAVNAEDAAAHTRSAAASSARARALHELATTQPVLRIHQEDLCQALGRPPTLKYQAEGGPGPEEIVALLREHSGHAREDVTTFLDALAFSWLTGGTDGHAKNYSILHGGGGRVRLAPLYDVASALPYRNLEPQKLKLAMKIGGKYRLLEIGIGEWRKLARNVRLPEDEVVGWIAGMASRMADCVRSVCAKVVEDGVSHPIIETLGDVFEERARWCLSQLRSRA